MSTIEQQLAEYENDLRAKGYEQLEPFYMLKEGEIYDERDGGTQKITKTRLDEIAATQNARTTDSGDATPIVIGHTKRHLAEREQPPIVGLAPRWEVVKFKKTPKWALQAYPWAKPGNVVLSANETITNKEAFDRFPRRSAEFWTNPDILDPISILGANTPRLDLGLHRLQEQRLSIQLGQGYKPRKPIILEMDMPDTDAMGLGTSSPATNGNMGDAAIFNSDRFKKVEDCCERFTQIADLLEPFLGELKASQAGGDMGGMGGAPMGGPPGAGGAPGGMPPPSAAAAPPIPPEDGEDEDDEGPARQARGTRMQPVRMEQRQRSAGRQRSSAGDPRR